MAALLNVILLVLPVVILGQSTIRPPNELSLELFRDVDRNSDGQVTRVEVDLYFKEYDVNGDGRITQQEFSQYIYTHHADLSQHDAQLYNFFDFNNDRFLDHTDFDNIFALIDSSGNGLVSQGEFVRYFNVIFGSLG